MGMAASQARLLAITARIHDVEFQAQSIQNAKLQLANNSDQVYNEYLAALDDTTLTIKDYDGNRIVANYNNLCGKNAIEVQGNSRYAIYDYRGRLIVPDEIFDGVENYLDDPDHSDNDPNLFALFMMNGKDFTEEMIDSYIDFKDDCEDEEIISIENQIHELFAQTEEYEDEPKANVYEYDYGVLNSTQRAEYDRLMCSLNQKMFKSWSKDVEEFKDDEFYNEYNYYARMWELIMQAPDIVPISDYDGMDGDAANNEEWLDNMIKCGKFTIDLVNFDTRKGGIKKVSSGVSSDTYLENTATSTIDKKAVAKAEAEYEHKMSQINAKDKKFDLELKKLETERNALTTEYNSVKKVIEDNIERTFGIFS